MSRPCHQKPEIWPGKPAWQGECRRERPLASSEDELRLQRRAAPRFIATQPDPGKKKQARKQKKARNRKRGVHGHLLRRSWSASINREVGQAPSAPAMIINRQCDSQFYPLNISPLRSQCGWPAPARYCRVLWLCWFSQTWLRLVPGLVGKINFSGGAGWPYATSAVGSGSPEMQIRIHPQGAGKSSTVAEPRTCRRHRLLAGGKVGRGSGAKFSCGAPEPSG